MGITLEPLDNSHDTDPSTIVVGRDVFVIFKPKASLMNSNKTIAELIATPNLLGDEGKRDKLQRLQNLTDGIEKSISESIRFRDMQGLDVDTAKSLFSYYKGRIHDNSKDIAAVENELGLYLAQDHRVYFCSKCDAYLGLATDPLPDKCKLCSEKLTKDISNAEVIRYLDGDILTYLRGSWIQDYVAKILGVMGWKTWTDCSIMGASGVYHSLDILAIKIGEGRVVIAECKRSAKGDHAFKLAAQFLDIQPSFGLLITLNKLDSEPGRSLLAKKPGLKLVELESNPDKMIEGVLDGYISHEN